MKAFIVDRYGGKSPMRRANGEQLREITRLIEAGAIRPVIDRVFPFESTPEALAYVETGRAKGKVVVKVK
jgi:NADPH:quinone reductase-like Zn-dependent oxidoreductase